MHAQLGGATGAWNIPRPSKRGGLGHMRCEVRAAGSHVAWEGSGLRQRHMHQRNLSSVSVSLSWTRRTSHPSIRMQRTQANADGSHSCVTPMDADLMPIWTRNIVWIPHQDHSSAVIKSGYTCIEIRERRYRGSVFENLCLYRIVTM